MQKKGLIFVISAPSGAGKSTLISEILSKYGSFKKPISFTTRSPRGNEVNGIDYFFVSLEEFEKMKNQNQFIEWAEVHGNFYATALDFVKQSIKEGIILIKDIDVQGAINLKASLKSKAVLIFVKTPSINDLEKRLRKRATDSEDVIQTRLNNAIKELDYISKYDHVVTNNKVDDAIADLSSIIDRYIKND